MNTPNTRRVLFAFVIVCVAAVAWIARGSPRFTGAQNDQPTAVINAVGPVAVYRSDTSLKYEFRVHTITRGGRQIQLAPTPPRDVDIWYVTFQDESGERVILGCSEFP